MSTKENLKTECDMEEESGISLTEKGTDTKDNMSTIKRAEKESSPGKMAMFTQGLSLTTPDMVKA